MQQNRSKAPLTRREFVQRVSLATAGLVGGAGLAGCSHSESEAEAPAHLSLAPVHPQEAKERTADRVGQLPRVRLGTRMGKMEISRIVISSDWNDSLYAPALKLGANFIHKAGYWKEKPDEFKNLPRDSYFTDITVDSTPNNPDDEEGAYNQVVESLGQNGLKYYDIFRAHYGWHSVEAFHKQRGTYKAFQRLKREGKVKYFGVSQHSHPENYPAYPEIIQAEIDSGIIDSMQVWFSAATRPDVLEAFAHARKAGIGLTAMKTFAHGNGPMQQRPEWQKQLGAEGKIGRACVRYALSATSPVTGETPVFHCCVSALGSLEMFEENMGAVGAKIAMADGFVVNV